MLNKYQEKFNRTIYLSVAILLGIASLSIFQIQKGQAQVETLSAPEAAAFLDAGFNPVLGGGNGQLVDNLVQADGKLLVETDFNVMNRGNRNANARFITGQNVDLTLQKVAGPNI